MLVVFGDNEPHKCTEITNPISLIEDLLKFVTVTPKHQLQVKIPVLHQL
jgi:hypothetical protein